MDQLFKKLRDGADAPTALGRSRDYNIDLIPKFIMSAGTLVKLLLHTKVTRYLEFKSVEGSYVYKKGQIYKVPATESEGLSTKLLGLFEKKRFRDFLRFLADYDPKKPKDGIDVETTPMKDIFKKYKLDSHVQDFVGHALALYQDDDYLERPARETMDRIAVYVDSLARHGKSPYIYPLYGLGELPQAFARLAAIYGGTYMLAKPIEEIVFDDSGAFVGVKSEGELAKAKMVIGDPSYFRDYSKVEKKGQVVRCICLLDHPVQKTNDCGSVQIIIPQNQVGRKKDIYVAVVSQGHNVAPQGKYIAIVSTIVETSQPEKELERGLALLEPIMEKFFVVDDVYEPVNSPADDKCYISSSYDSSSHFETSSDDILALYKKITGQDIEFKEHDDQDDE